MSRTKKTILAMILLFLIGVGIGVVYYYMVREEPQPVNTAQQKSGILTNYIYLKIFYPMGGRVELVEKRIPEIMSQIRLAERVLKEYLDTAQELNTGVIPEGVRVEDLYLSSDGILYVDFNRAIERNFKGDIVDEYILIKSLYESIVSNLDVQDVVVLIDHKEAETIGGHFLINKPLKRFFSEEQLIIEEAAQ
ncbi:MAG: hypothetical protein D6710_01395 [Nitrospirae bacterium]|nr:MAG: hypothetical protein D6710_01395 [Nitrospirota bacterium]